MSARLIATSIPYMNGRPHMGHAMEFCLADVLARYNRVAGNETFFLTGSDEHGSKIFNKAKELDKEPLAMLDENVEVFQALEKRLSISVDDFIRTTDRERHWATAQDVWNKIAAKGDIYKKSYQGLYCEGCEAFVQEKDLVDGMCPTHKKKPVVIEEENYFFALSKYSDLLKDLLETDKVKITPAYRRNELLTFIREGLQDVSFSRAADKMPWGIPVPGDDSQVMYVWCDALTNYLSGAGYATDKARFAKFGRTYAHVIGKDISRFHALIYMAMLVSAGLETSENILIHGFVVSNGEKMSKSLGNVVDPDDVLAEYVPDALRYFLAAGGGNMGEDIDFTHEGFKNLYNSALVNGLGNLANRTSVLFVKNFPDGVSSKGFALPDAVDSAIVEAHANYRAALEAFETKQAYAEVTKLIDLANKHFDDTKPWTIKEDPTALRDSLLVAVEILYHVSALVSPYLPDTFAKLKGIFAPMSPDFALDGSFRLTGNPKILLATVPLLFERK